jgi:hypothetical protein
VLRRMFGLKRYEVIIRFKSSSSSSSYSITKSGQGVLFRSQHSYRLVVSSLVVQVVVFLLDGILEVVYGACSLPELQDDLNDDGMDRACSNACEK